MDFEVCGPDLRSVPANCTTPPPPPRLPHPRMRRRMRPHGKQGRGARGRGARALGGGGPGVSPPPAQASSNRFLPRYTHSFRSRATACSCATPRPTCSCLITDHTRIRSRRIRANHWSMEKRSILNYTPGRRAAHELHAVVRYKSNQIAAVLYLMQCNSAVTYTSTPMSM